MKKYVIVEQLQGAVISEICQICSTRKINTTAYHQQTDGMVERINKTLAQMLAAYINSTQTNWDVLLPYLYYICI